MRVLVTGSVGFIGYHLCSKLAADGHEVVGVDNFSDYYSVSLKEERLARLLRLKNFRFYRADITDQHAFEKVFVYKFDLVVHLAAQAGVRYSLENPEAYIQTNVLGFFNVLECCRKHNVKRLLFASSSSVYGNTDGCAASSEKSDTSKPVSLYAATKKADEVLAYSYSHLYEMDITALRFFTVYGEWGRPDMAYYKFARNIYLGEPVTLYDGGSMLRDFTYVGDAVECVRRVVMAEGDGFTAYNIGCGTPVRVAAFADTLYKEMSRVGLAAESVEFKNAPMQSGDVAATHADPAAFEQAYGYKPSTRLEDGLGRFVEWLKNNPRFVCL